MFDERSVQELLEQVARHERTVEQALGSLSALPFEQVDGFACLDHHRAIRCGSSEVIYCAGKTPDQVAAIAERLAARSSTLLGTRASPAHFDAAARRVPDLQFDEPARCIWLDREPDRERHDGVALVAAGTSRYTRRSAVATTTAVPVTGQ